MRLRSSVGSAVSDTLHGGVGAHALRVRSVWAAARAAQNSPNGPRDGHHFQRRGVRAIALPNIHILFFTFVKTLLTETTG